MQPICSEPDGTQPMCSGVWVTRTYKPPSAPMPIYRRKTWARCSSAIKRSVDDEHQYCLETDNSDQAHRGVAGLLGRRRVGHVSQSGWHCLPAVQSAPAKVHLQI